MKLLNTFIPLLVSSLAFASAIPTAQNDPDSDPAGEIGKQLLAPTFQNYTRACGTDEPAPELMAQAEEFKTTSEIQALAATSYTVKVYMHVVTTKAKAGKYSQSMVNKQVSHI